MIDINRQADDKQSNATSHNTNKTSSSSGRRKKLEIELYYAKKEQEERNKILSLERKLASANIENDCCELDESCSNESTFVTSK